MEAVNVSGCYVRDEDCPDIISECFTRVDSKCGVSIICCSKLASYLAVLLAC